MIGMLILQYFKRRNVRGLQHLGKDSFISGIPKCIDASCLYIGNNSEIHSGARIMNISGSDSVCVKIGNRTGIQFNLTILAGANVTIGDNVAIASDVFISAGGHLTDPETDLPYGSQRYTGKEIVIKDGAWIGEKACILSGVIIGKKSVVGAGSVVTKNVPDYCIAVGNPAKVIKKYNFETHVWEKVNE